MLEKVVELPDKKLASLIKSNALSGEYLMTVTQRLPHFLTATIANIARVSVR